VLVVLLAVVILAYRDDSPRGRVRAFTARAREHADLLDRGVAHRAITLIPVELSLYRDNLPKDLSAEANAHVQLIMGMAAHAREIAQMGLEIKRTHGWQTAYETCLGPFRECAANIRESAAYVESLHP
jgi:hypothetical protein